jgi:outer membrane protein
MRLTPLAALALVASPVAAQTPPRASAPQAAPEAAAVATLTLEEAVSLARRNNPQHLSTLNDRTVAGSQLRSAYGSYLPSLRAQFGSQYREGLQQLVAGQRFGAASDQISSSYDLGLEANYSVATVITPRLQRANLRAADASVAGSTQRLRGTVTQQYINVLQQTARAALQDTLLATAQAQLALAKARADVGAVTPLDVRRAEVAVGQQEVASLQARNQIEIEKVRLFQQLGVRQPANVVLTTQFAVTDQQVDLDELLTLARRSNPTLEETRSRERVASLSYRNAQAQYTPTLSLSTGIGGYTNQYTDNGFVLDQALDTKRGLCAANAGNDPAQAAACRDVTLTNDEAAAARAENRKYPFQFQRNPISVSAFLTIPLFNGFQREQRVQEAAAQRNDARFGVRAQELQIESDVTAAVLNLNAARQTVSLQQRNAATARQALTLAQERYRVGLNTFVDVAQSRGDYERAENDRISAIYEYHKAFAALESAVGRPIR